MLFKGKWTLERLSLMNPIWFQLQFLMATIFTFVLFRYLKGPYTQKNTCVNKNPLNNCRIMCSIYLQ